MKQLNESRKKPYTVVELFERIVGILKESNELPSILDYGLSSNHSLQKDPFSLECALEFGNNEGIYLDIFLVDDNCGKRKMGTFKTLNNSKEALRTMAALGADFIWTGCNFICEYSDDFAWSGYKVYPIRKDGSIPQIIYCPSTLEDAMAHIWNQMKSHDDIQQIILRDNSKKVDTIIKREDLIG